MPKTLQEGLMKWKENQTSSVKGVKLPKPISKKIRAVSPKTKTLKLKNTPISTRNPVRDYVGNRKIRDLYHFTPSINLSGILEKGILPRSELSSAHSETSPMYNDLERWDHCLDASCCSIGFPNYKTFSVFKGRNPDISWVVIALEPAILWSKTCLYNKTNAANKICSSVSRKERSSIGALKEMFKDGVHSSNSNPEDAEGLRRLLGLSDWMTTDPQAEVLVVGQIPVSLIKYVAFENNYSKAKIEGRLPKHLRQKVDLKVVPELFGNRKDWKYLEKDNTKFVGYNGADLDDEIPF
jgi:hypothetical protein